MLCWRSGVTTRPAIAGHPSVIALSSLNADDLVKKVGDTVTLLIDGVETELRVSGVYSDAARSLFVLLIGILLGTLLANTLGEPMAGMAIASLGASQMHFVVNPLSAYLISPLLMIGAVLMATLAGTDPIDSGKVVFDGIELSRLGERQLSDLRRTGMGFIFQQPTMLANLNILDNIILPAVRDARSKVAELTAKARRLMKQVGIDGLEHREITQVSGGQLQRAEICRALINDPKLLFGEKVCW